MAPAAAEDQPEKTAFGPPTVARIQTKVKMRFKLGPILDLTDPVMEMDPVAPPLDFTNAQGRLIHVPASVWPGLAAGGFVGKIRKVDKRGNKPTEVQFHDGKTTLGFDFIVEECKAIS